MRFKAAKGFSSAARAAFVFSTLFLGSCATFSSASLQPEPTLKQQAVEEGQASWYGPGFQGRRTASGARFNSNDLTCAHRSLPFGTKLKVTNLANGSEVIVIVNDRGPFIGGRIVDLSREAAKHLDFVRTGTAPVRLQVVDL